jgi:histone-lysine N-methyltransferase SETMAR
MRVAKCGKLLRVLEAMQRIYFHHIITGDESWFYPKYQHTSQWSISGNEVPQKVNLATGTAKFMLMAVWGVNGFHLLDVMPSQCRFNAQYFREHVMMPLVQMVFPQKRIWYTPRFNVHLDNCPVHFSKVTEHLFIENQLLHVSHPPYSPDLAPSDFWLFGRIKTGFVGRRFAEPDELLEL